MRHGYIPFFLYEFTGLSINFARMAPFLANLTDFNLILLNMSALNPGSFYRACYVIEHLHKYMESAIGTYELWTSLTKRILTLFSAVDNIIPLGTLFQEGNLRVIESLPFLLLS